MADRIEVRSVASGFNYVVYRDVNNLGHPRGGMTKGWAPTESQARQKAHEVTE